MTLVGKTRAQIDAEQAAKAMADEIAAIKLELAALDLASIRALRADRTGTAKQEDRDRLAEIEAKVQSKRARLEEIKTD